jgi:hypothetical protein
VVRYAAGLVSQPQPNAYQPALAAGSGDAADARSPTVPLTDDGRQTDGRDADGDEGHVTPDDTVSGATGA